MHTQTITLWNYHEASGLWYPTTIPGVSIYTDNSYAASEHGNNANNSVWISIPCSRNGRILDVSGVEKLVLKPKTYAVCQSPSCCLSFSPGVDFILEEEVDGLEPVRDTDYESGFYDAMNAANDSIHLITSNTGFNLIPHYEIGCK